MPIQRKNLFLTWGIRISLVPVILILLALGLIAIVLFAICGVCGRFLAALGGLAALLALFDKCYQEGGSIRHRGILAQPLRRAAGAVLAGQKAARVCW